MPEVADTEHPEPPKAGSEGVDTDPKGNGTGPQGASKETVAGGEGAATTEVPEPPEVDAASTVAAETASANVRYETTGPDKALNGMKPFERFSAAPAGDEAGAGAPGGPRWFAGRPGSVGLATCRAGATCDSTGLCMALPDHDGRRMERSSRGT